MRAALFAMVVAVTACGRWTIPVQQPEPPHRMTEDEINAIPNAFPVTIRPPHHAKYQPFVDNLARHNMIDKAGWLTSVVIDLRRVNVPVVIEECDGDENAFYIHGKQQIRLCYEFMALIHRLAGSPEELFDADVTYMIAFTTLHEIGHALMDVMNVQVSARDEEERADQFAFLLMTNHDDADLARRVIHAPASFFLHLDDIEDHDNDDTEEHGNSAHRAANAICLLWGRQHVPQLADNMAGGRGARCEAYTSEALATWNRWLRPYTRIDTGETF